ncbi:DNA sulfur modification protein DndD [Paenibacillus sp. CFBP 13594]|uniref:DNA sulfur modification protein DndD n=1 Tax=Paenibacillus sp. CFBP 13594 TaxID=2774037 RepID=UPI00177EC0E8|nr:DNA sulfur modification protein DndD [Paenibacillus sp. CFBP 13594]MBD8838445.1 DNA sulfur modification protein DndD [Paenibacillus sp. CFBP 13594]
MHIQKLALRNIGAYHGELNKFDFRTTANRNVILLGGKNGAGKTTILESLRIVLFGSMAYGFVTENEPYFRKIRTLLNRKAINENVTDEFQITLDYISTEDFELHEYSLVRSWRIKNERIRESFAVKRDNQFLSAQQTSDFQSRLREEMPPKLFELCLFDGEDISRIVSEEKIPEYLKESGKILFNLDLFVNLEKDLNTYRIQYAQQNASAAEEVAQYEQLEMEIDQLKATIDEKQQLTVLHEEEINNLNDAIKQDKKDFEIHGGLLQEKRQEIVSRVNIIENKRKTNSEHVRHFVSSLLPFFIARKQLRQVYHQLNGEKQYESYNYVANSLVEEKLASLLNNVLGPSKKVDEREVTSVFEGLLNLIKPDQTKLIHRASFEQRSEIHNLNKQIQALNVTEYVSRFDENAILLKESQELRTQLETNDQASEFKELLERIEQKTKQAEQHNMMMEQIEFEIQALSESLHAKILQKEKVEDKIREYHKSEKSYEMTEKLLKVSQRFRERQWRKKLDDVANEAVRMIDVLFRKKDFLKRIHIDHTTFELKLYNRMNQEISKERLSAGEKEMLMLTVILAMFRVSGWKLPFVFDTLMGRLDQDHKKSLIQHFIPRCGEQVLMFTTDSEITSEQFHVIEEITARCYTLEYNSSLESAVIVKDRYFDIVREAGQNS